MDTKKILIKIKQFTNKCKRTVPRIIIEPDKCFSDEEYELRKNTLTQATINNINDNFSKMVKKVVSLSASGNKIYVECIGTLDEHFITVLTARLKSK